MSKYSMLHKPRALLPHARLLALLIVSAVTAMIGAPLKAAVPSLVSGDGHYFALDGGGILYGWGRNDFGQLGLGGKPPSTWGGPSFPVVVAPPQGLTWTAVAAGDNHSLAITSDGSLWAWGRNDAAQLSFRTSLPRRWLSGGMRETSPVHISSEKNWLAVSGGMLCSFALKQDGSLWGWGGNWTGQSGSGTGALTDFTAPIDKLPQTAGLNRIGKDGDWIRVNAGAEHVLAQKRDGTLWAWGRNDCGQLGLGTYVSTNRPVRISAETNWLVFATAGVGQRGAWSAAIKRDGTLWVWGNWKRLKLPKAGALANDTNMESRPVRFGSDTNWVHVSCGNEVGAATRSDGTLWTWGEPGSQLSAATTTPRQLGLDQDWSDVSVDGVGFNTLGEMHALKRDGTVWTWNAQIFPATGIPPTSAAFNGAPHQILRLRQASKAP